MLNVGLSQFYSTDRFLVNKASIFLSDETIHKEELFRVASFNMLNSREDIESRTTQLIQHINKHEIDALGLQEVLLGEGIVERVSAETSLKYCCSDEEYLRGFPQSGADRNVVLTSTPQRSRYIQTESPRPVALVETRVGKYVVNIFSAHLSHGQQGGLRLLEAQKINAAASELRRSSTHPHQQVILLAADVNETSQGAAYRYLRGYQPEDGQVSTYWVDAWEVAGSPENEVTSNPKDYWNVTTGLKRGVIAPSLAPERRIDYLMSYGWCYGKLGSPVTFGRFDDDEWDQLHVSDHYGIYSDIFFPGEFRE